MGILVAKSPYSIFNIIHGFSVTFALQLTNFWGGQASWSPGKRLGLWPNRRNPRSEPDRRNQRLYSPRIAIRPGVGQIGVGGSSNVRLPHDDCLVGGSTLYLSECHLRASVPRRVPEFELDNKAWALSRDAKKERPGIGYYLCSWGSFFDLAQLPADAQNSTPVIIPDLRFKRGRQ
jgi:hypothetical protein